MKTAATIQTSDIEILEDNAGGLLVQSASPELAVYLGDKRSPDTIENLKLIAEGGVDLSDWEGQNASLYITDDAYAGLSEGGGIRLWRDDDLADAIA